MQVNLTINYYYFKDGLAIFIQEKKYNLCNSIPYSQ